MGKKKCLFIINPISGLGKQKTIPDLIKKHLDTDKFTYEILFSEYAGHSPKLTAEHKGSCDIIVAVGGDGTVNEVATALVDTSTSLGVIPLGSGNGFARYLDISTQSAKAIAQFNTSQPTYFDTGVLNGKAFFNVSGVGFDGQISKIFAEQLKRGFMTYARCMMEEYQTFVPKKFRYQLNGKTIEEPYFLIAFANTSQYGNNAIIAPHADASDGKLDVVLVSPFPALHLPALSMMSLFSQLHRSPYVKIIKAESFILDNEEEAPVHVDGEYLNHDRQLQVSIKPGSLKVMAPVK